MADSFTVRQSKTILARSWARERSPRIWIVDAHRSDGKRFVVRAIEKLTFLELEAGDSVFVGGLKIDHRWPQCDAHGLMMKLEIRSTGE